MSSMTGAMGGGNAGVAYANWDNANIGGAEGAVSGVLGGILGAAVPLLGDIINWMSSSYTRDKTWEREDNAVFRRKLDLEHAGFSPVLAAGMPAQTSIAPSPRVSGDEGMSALQGMAIVQGLRQTAANISKTRAETSLINQQKRIIDYNQSYFDKFGLPTTATVDSWMKIYGLLEPIIMDLVGTKESPMKNRGKGLFDQPKEQIRKGIEQNKNPLGNLFNYLKKIGGQSSGRAH